MKQRKGGHSTVRLTVHLVWVSKYRYEVLQGPIKIRCRDLLMQICDAEDIQILKGVVSSDHVHMHIEYPSKLSISEIVKKLKGRTSRRIQEEYPSVGRRYWGRHFWAIGYGAWSSGNVSESVVQEYLSTHKQKSNQTKSKMRLE